MEKTGENFKNYNRFTDEGLDLAGLLDNKRGDQKAEDPLDLIDAYVNLFNVG